MSNIGIWITVAIVLFVLGSIFGLRVSPREKALGMMRDQARKMGLHPRLIAAPKIRDSNAKIKEGSEGFQAADSVQKIGNFKDDPADPKNVPSAPKEPVVDGKQVHEGLKLPPYEPGTLDNTETRKVYTTGEQEIRAMIAQDQANGLSAEQTAKNAFERRNALRTWCRQLMADQAAAAGLNQTDPNLTWEQLMQKQAAKGNTGEAAYNAVIESSTRSRPSVNQSTGVDPENPGPLPPVRSAPQPEPGAQARPGAPEAGAPQARPVEPEPGGLPPRSGSNGGEFYPGGRMIPRIEPPDPTHGGPFEK